MSAREASDSMSEKTPTDLLITIAMQRAELLRLRQLLAAIASLPPPNPAKEIAAKALTSEL